MPRTHLTSGPPVDFASTEWPVLIRTLFPVPVVLRFFFPPIMMGVSLVVILVCTSWGCLPQRRLHGVRMEP